MKTPISVIIIVILVYIVGYLNGFFNGYERYKFEKIEGQLEQCQSK